MGNLCMGAKNFEKPMHRNEDCVRLRKDNLGVTAFEVQRAIVISLGKIVPSSVSRRRIFLRGAICSVVALF